MTRIEITQIRLLLIRRRSADGVVAIGGIPGM